MYAPVFIISLLSAYLASGGLALLLENFSGVGAVQALSRDWLGAEPEATLIFLAWLLAALLQLLIFVVWRRAFHRVGGEFSAWTIGLIFSFASMAVSSGTAVYQVANLTLREQAAQEARAPIVQAAESARASALEIVKTIGELSRSAQRKSERERLQGHSCVESVGRGGGAITIRRAKHAGDMADLGSGLQVWLRRVEDAANLLRVSPPDQAELEARTSALREVFRDPALPQARGIVAVLRDDLDPDVGWSTAEGLHRCTDPESVALANGALEKIDGLADLAISAPHMLRVTPADGFRSVWEALQARLGGRETEAVGFAGLMIAFVVEAVQILLIQAAVAAKSRRGETPHRLDAFAEGRSPERSPQRKARDEATADVVRRSMVTYRKRLWLVSPLPPSPRDMSAITHLQLKQPEPLHAALPLSLISRLPEFSGRGADLQGSAFDMRELPKDILSWLQRVERDRTRRE